FEGIAASLAGIVALACLREWRKALLAAAILAACLAAYAAGMAALGLPLLPNSVVLKSGVAGAAARFDLAGMVAAVEQKLVEVSTLPPARIVGALAIAVAFGAAVGAIATWRRSGWRQLVVPLFLLAILVAHLAAGSYGWIDRYEVYILVTGIAGLAYVDRGFLRLAIAGLSLPIRHPLRFAGGAAAIAILCGAVIHYGGHYFRTTLNTPAGAYNIYEQQGQMSRFVRDFYRAPVAVNDLGYVAWRNPNYVLDIAGLGSQEVRAIQSGASRETIDDLLRRHEIGLAMVYDDPDFGRQPAWTPVAYLRLGTPRVTPYRSTVTFYRTPYGSPEKIAEALAAFAGAVLPGEIFERWPECGESIALAELPRGVPEGSASDAPGVRQFRCPLTVRLGERLTADAITAQVDGQDTTWFRLYDGNSQVGQVKAVPVKRPGLWTVTLTFPPVAFDTIRVEGGYDDRYAIRGLTVRASDGRTLP
ncbi:MAG TPA: hypothetical protein VFB16_05155, partial [Bauldia sp.]|nr:hypothetical protein [Bauldia sp.]